MSGFDAEYFIVRFSLWHNHLYGVQRLVSKGENVQQAAVSSAEKSKKCFFDVHLLIE